MHLPITCQTSIRVSESDVILPVARITSVGYLTQLVLIAFKVFSFEQSSFSMLSVLIRRKEECQRGGERGDEEQCSMVVLHSLGTDKTMVDLIEMFTIGRHFYISATKTSSNL